MKTKKKKYSMIYSPHNYLSSGNQYTDQFYDQYGLGSWLKKSFNKFGNWVEDKALPAIGDVGAGVLDTALSTVGLGNVVNKDWYSSDTTARKAEDIVGVGSKILGAGLMAVPFLGAGAKGVAGLTKAAALSGVIGKGTSALQGLNTDENTAAYNARMEEEAAVRNSTMTPTQKTARIRTLPASYSGVSDINKSFNMGGDITRYNGYTHEYGGIPLGLTGDEVEGDETRGIPGTSTEDYIFSDRLKTLGGNMTFAKKSKNISNKYSLRPWDIISKDAKERELDALMAEHEIVRKADELNETINAYGGKVYGKGGHWIQKAVNPKHKGYCTPMTKSTCTGRRRALALTFKKHHGFHKKDDGGFVTMDELINDVGREKLNRTVDSGNIKNTIYKRYPQLKRACGGKLYPGGGELLDPYQIQVDTTLTDTMTPARRELMAFKTVNNPELYKNLDAGKIGTYFSALKGDNTVATPLTTAFLENINKVYGPTTGIYYNPSSSSFDVIDEDRNPTLYKKLKSKYANTVKEKEVPKVGFRYTSGEGTKGIGPVKKYGFGDFLSAHPAEVGALAQGVGLLGKQFAARKIKPKYLQYTPLSSLDEASYAPPVSGLEFAPTDISEALKAYDTGYRGYEHAIAESVDSPAAYLTRMSTAAGSKSAGKADLVEGQANKDILRKLQVDQANKEIQAQNLARRLSVAGSNKNIEASNLSNKLSIDQYNADQERMIEGLRLGMFDEWGDLLSGYIGDKQREKNLDAMMQIAGTENYGFKRNPKTGRYKKVYSK